MISNAELQRWLASLPHDAMIGVDEGGLTLIVAGSDEGSDAYLEIGGLPEVYPDPSADVNGTSLVGNLDPIRYPELVAKLGEPHLGPSGDDKVDAEWIFHTPAGVATIYNYKSGPAYNPGENISLDDVDDWHIGGASQDVVSYIREYVGQGE